MAARKDKSRTAAEARTVPHSALERGFAVLHCFEPVSRPLANADLSRMTGIPKPTITRVVATLVSLGYLAPARETDHYELTARPVRLARAFLDAIDVRTTARQHLADLAELAHAVAFLGVRDGPHIIVVEAQRSRSVPVLLRAGVGTRLPLTTSAMGRAWLAALSEKSLEKVFHELSTIHGVEWPRMTVELKTKLEETRLAGCCISIGDWHPEINTAAVPIRTATDDLLVINCGGPAFTVPEERMRAMIVPRLLQTAHVIANEVGGSSGREAIRYDSPDTGREPRQAAG